MGQGKIPDQTYKSCHICGKLVKRNLGMIGHMKVHNKIKNKEQKKLEVDYALYKQNDKRNK
jgi:hypothetical protein